MAAQTKTDIPPGLEIVAHEPLGKKQIPVGGLLFKTEGDLKLAEPQRIGSIDPHLPIRIEQVFGLTSLKLIRRPVAKQIEKAAAQIQTGPPDIEPVIRSVFLPVMTVIHLQPTAQTHLKSCIFIGIQVKTIMIPGRNFCRRCFFIGR